MTCTAGTGTGRRPISCTPLGTGAATRAHGPGPPASKAGKAEDNPPSWSGGPHARLRHLAGLVVVGRRKDGKLLPRCRVGRDVRLAAAPPVIELPGHTGAGAARRAVHLNIPSYWTSDDPADRQMAVRYCKVCSVRLICLDWSLFLPAEYQRRATHGEDRVASGQVAIAALPASDGLVVNWRHAGVSGSAVAGLVRCGAVVWPPRPTRLQIWGASDVDPGRGRSWRSEPFSFPWICAYDRQHGH
jgi:hypothetical protein